MRQIARGRDQQVGRRVNFAIVILNHRLIEALDGLARAQNRLAERVILPEVRRKNLVDQIVGTVRVHLDFFENDAFFLLDVFVAECGVQHEIAQYVHGDRQMFVEHLGVEADHLFRGESVEIAADRIDGAGDLLGRPVRRAFEQHVLDEMRDAVFLRSLAPGAAGDPNSHRHRAHVRHRFRNDFDSIRQSGSQDVALLCGRRARLRFEWMTTLVNLFHLYHC